MIIDLDEKLVDHFARLEELATEAEEGAGESFSSRASAMGALNGMLKELVKVQAETVNMARLLSVEQALIESAKELFEPAGYDLFTEKLRELLEKSDS